MMQPKFADLHHHVLWGMDDGPKTPGEMHAQLRAAHDDGIALIAATCHAAPAIQPFNLALYQQRLQEANEICRSEGWALQVVQGCEIRYCQRVPDLLQAGLLPTLGGTRYVLLEFAGEASQHSIARAADGLYRRGYWPVIAHVERCRSLVRSPKKAIALREELGLIYQVDCDAVLAPGGIWRQRFMRWMIQEQAIDLLCTDAHDTAERSVRMSEAFRCIEQQDTALARKLLETPWRIMNEK